MSKLLSVLLAAVLICGYGFAESLVKASINKTQVKTGEHFVYRIEIEGEFVEPKIYLPDFGQLRIVSQNQTKNYIFTGERKVVKIILVYQLLADQPGSYVIDSVVVKDRTDVFKSEAITVKVTGEPLKDEMPADLLDEAITL